MKFVMTDNANLKRRVRSRAAKTGESYTAARRHVASTRATLRVALSRPRSPCCGQTRARATSCVRAGRGSKLLMGEAAAAGASLAHFPEGALCSPNKRVMSSRGPELVADADWDLGGAARRCWPSSTPLPGVGRN